MIYLWVGIPWSRKAKWILTILFFIFPVAVVLIFGLFSETLYAVRMDAPKFSTHPPPVQERSLSGLSADEIYKDMRDAPDRSLDQRKSEWRKNYEGKWVEWEGTVTYLSIYDSSSSLKLKTSPDLPFEVEVNFDPLLNPSLKELSEGDSVKVSGMLWGYDYLMEEIRLADGAIIDAKQPKAPSPDSET